MKLVQFLLQNGKVRLGILNSKGDEVIDLNSSGNWVPNNLVEILREHEHAFQLLEKISEKADTSYPLTSVHLLSPITRPDKILCIGYNYEDYCKELNVKNPEEPLVFSKFASTIIGPYDSIKKPASSEAVDWEIELVVIIGKLARNVKAEDAYDHVFGYTATQDLTAKDLVERFNGRFLLSKNTDHFCPLGPCVVTKDEIKDPHDLHLKTWVNGVLKQDGNTRDLIYGVDRLIEYLSSMQKPLFPLSQLKDLRCRHCQKFISCGPVYVVPDSSVLCGRCRMLAKDIYRNFSYEALASIFRYPCVNWENHCPISLQWNESLSHEGKCTYQGCWRFFCSHPGACFKGRREILDGVADIRLIPVPDHLLEHIKCIQCENYLSCEPVYIQTNGKNICHRCVLANGPPPNCLRNLAYEKISRIIIFPCIFRNRGCPTRLQFGRDLWQHESLCSYGQTFQKLTQKPISNHNNATNNVEVAIKKEKERGVIKTHSGHTWGTITPNSQLFAPPTPNDQNNNSNNINKEVIKSLVKKQERIIKRADEIGQDFHRMNSSEEGSNISNNSSIFTNTNRSSVSPTERRHWDDPVIIRHSKVEPPQIHYPQEDYSNNSSRVHSRASSTRTPRSPDTVPNMLSETDVLGGHIPIFGAQKKISVSSYDSGLDSNANKRLSRHGSVNGPRDLINELKVRQGLIKKTHSVKGRQDLESVRDEPLSPYQQCQNLEDILQVHDRLK